MSKIPYIVRRNDTLYFRIRVPVSLQQVTQRTEIVQTLQTQSRQDAIPVALELAGKVKSVFNVLSKDMKEKSEVEKAIDKLIEAGERSRDDFKQAAAESKNKSGGESLKSVVREWRLKERLYKSEEDHFNAMVKAADERIKNNKTLLDTKIKAATLIKAERDEVARLKESETGLRAENKVIREIFGNDGFGGRSSPVKVSSKAPKLSLVIDQFCQDCGAAASTMKKYRSTFPIFLELMGDVAVCGIDHFEVNKFFGDLSNLPPRRDGKFKGMSYKQMIAENDGMGLAKKSFNGHKSNIKMLVTWAKDQYRGAFDGVNVADVQYKGSRVSSESGQRSFKPDELNTLFNCASMQRYCADGKQVHKFWLPVIGLYTGMRVNEICQLNPCIDVLSDGDIWYFLVSADTEAAPDIVKSVKSGTAREVPIHSKLIDLGLLDYVGALKTAGHKRMFPQDTAKDGRAGDNTARNFRRYLDDNGLRDDTANSKILGMHAFRKTIITYAYSKEFLRDLLCVVGHEDDARDEEGKVLPDVTRLYIDDDAMKAPLLIKKQAIEKVVFDIDFYVPVKPVFE